MPCHRRRRRSDSSEPEQQQQQQPVKQTIRLTVDHTGKSLVEFSITSDGPTNTRVLVHQLSNPGGVNGDGDDDDNDNGVETRTTQSTDSQSGYLRSPASPSYTLGSIDERPSSPSPSTPPRPATTTTTTTTTASNKTIGIYGRPRITFDRMPSSVIKKMKTEK